MKLDIHTNGNFDKIKLIKQANGNASHIIIDFVGNDLELWLASAFDEILDYGKIKIIKSKMKFSKK